MQMKLMTHQEILLSNDPYDSSKSFIEINIHKSDEADGEKWKAYKGTSLSLVMLLLLLKGINVILVRNIFCEKLKTCSGRESMSPRYFLCRFATCFPKQTRLFQKVYFLSLVKLFIQGSNYYFQIIFKLEYIID